MPTLQRGEEWRYVTMVAKFLDHNKRELALQRRRRQRERRRKQQPRTSITLFCTFLSPASLNDSDMKRSYFTRPLYAVREHNTKCSFSFSELRYGPFGFNPKFRHYLTHQVKLNKIDELWNSANVLLRAVFGLTVSSRNFATMATWRNDFSSLLMSPSFYSLQFPFASLVISEQSLTLKICLPN